MKKIFALFSLSIATLACSNPGFQLPDTSQQIPQNIYFNNKVDVVMMVDNSSSMLPKQQKLSAQIPSMINSLVAQGIDFHIVITTTDIRTGGNGGRFVGSPTVLTNRTANVAAVLQNRVLQGETGSDLEQGLRSVQDALDLDLKSSAPQFIRDDAMLAVIILSDENDWSSGSSNDYINYFESIKRPFASGNRSWIMNYIGILPNDELCKTAGGYADPGGRYLDVTNYSGGVSESICNADLGRVVTNVRTRINQFLSDYYLDRAPKPETISVSKNGAAVPNSATNGWVLLQDAKSGKYYIRFSGSYVPNPTDKVIVNYSPASAT